MKTIAELHTELIESAGGQGQEVRKHKTGQHGHQGDVYCHPVKSRPACWNIETTDQERQVAVGQGEGSNHRAAGKVRIFWPESAEKAANECPLNGFFANDEAARRECLGPIVVAEEPWTLTHPRHAHHEFPAGTYLVSFQLDRRTMRRVQD